VIDIAKLILVSRHAKDNGKIYFLC